MGPEIVLHMLLGAIVGWAILSPYAKARGWAPGEVDDWNAGSRGWLIWVSLAALIADTLVKMVWICLCVFWENCGPLVVHIWRTTRDQRHEESHERPYMPISGDPNDSGNENLGSSNGNEDLDNYHATIATETNKGNALGWYSLVFGFVVSVALCVFTTTKVFNGQMPWFFVLLAILLALPMATTGIRCLGESDFNPQTGLGTSLYPLIRNLLFTKVFRA